MSSYPQQHQHQHQHPQRPAMSASSSQDTLTNHRPLPHPQLLELRPLQAPQATASVAATPMPPYSSSSSSAHQHSPADRRGSVGHSAAEHDPMLPPAASGGGGDWLAMPPALNASASSSSMSASAALGQSPVPSYHSTAEPTLTRPHQHAAKSPLAMHNESFTSTSNLSSHLHVPSPSTPSLAPDSYYSGSPPSKSALNNVAANRLSRTSTTRSRPDAPEVELRRRKTRASARRVHLAVVPTIGITGDSSDDEALGAGADPDAVIESQMPGGEFDWELTGGGPGHKSGGGDDEDDEGLRKSHRRRCQWFRDMYRKLPFGLQCLISVVLGDALIFAVLGLTDIAFSKTQYWTVNIMGQGPTRAPDGTPLPPKHPDRGPIDFWNWTSNLNIGGMPLLFWSFYIMLSYTLHWATLFVLNILPTLLQRSLVVALGTYYEDRLVEYTSILRALHRNLTIAIWAILSNVMWSFFITGNQVLDWKWQWQDDFRAYLNVKNNSTKMWWDYVGTVLMAILFSSLIWTGKRLLVVLVVTRFQRTAYSSRIKKMRFADDVLRKLNHAVKRMSTHPNTSRPSSRPSTPSGSVAVSMSGNSSSNASPSRRGAGAIDNSSTTAVHLDPTNAASARHRSLKDKGLARARKLFARKAQAIAKNVGHMLLDPAALQNATSIPLTLAEAHMLAKNLYYALAQPGAEDLIVADFEPYFDSPQDARRAFRLFDKDGNGDVSKLELKQNLVEMMKEKQNLEDSMQDTAKAVGSLERLFSAIAAAIILFVVLTVFQVKVDFTSFLTLLLPLSFVFGSSLKDLFESLIFLFVYHSFSVGDRIIIDKDMYLVKSLSIFTTVLQRGDGKIVHYPNTVLSKKPIDNVRQSGGMSEDIFIKMALDTPASHIHQLEDRMRVFLAEYARDYVAEGFKCSITEMQIELKLMVVCMCLNHKSHWQNMGMKIERRNRFMYALREAIMEIGIKCPEPFAVVMPGGYIKKD